MGGVAIVIPVVFQADGLVSGSRLSGFKHPGLSRSIADTRRIQEIGCAERPGKRIYETTKRPIAFQQGGYRGNCDRPQQDKTSQQTERDANPAGQRTRCRDEYYITALAPARGSQHKLIGPHAARQLPRAQTPTGGTCQAAIRRHGFANSGRAKGTYALRKNKYQTSAATPVITTMTKRYGSALKSAFSNAVSSGT